MTPMKLNDTEYQAKDTNIFFTSTPSSNPNSCHSMVSRFLITGHFETSTLNHFKIIEHHKVNGTPYIFY